jgi:hypothetical protein
MRHNSPSTSAKNYFKSPAIITPPNKNVQQVNAQCLRLLPGKIYFSESINQMTDVTERAVPEEILNSVNVPNFPEHRLALKVGMPVILLQNLCLNPPGQDPEWASHWSSSHDPKGYPYS